MLTLGHTVGHGVFVYFLARNRRLRPARFVIHLFKLEANAADPAGRGHYLANRTDISTSKKTLYAKPYPSRQYGIQNSGTYLFTVFDRLGKSNVFAELMCMATIVRSSGIYLFIDFNHLRKRNDNAELS